MTNKNDSSSSPAFRKVYGRVGIQPGNQAVGPITVVDLPPKFLVPPDWAHLSNGEIWNILEGNTLSPDLKRR
jgi:hypothetical protein